MTGATDGLRAHTATGIVRALVVDDEPDGRATVITMLRNHARIQVVGVSTNGREGIRAVRELRPDLVFLDVAMPDLDGFGMLEALGDDTPRGIVFVTAHDEHAVQAFEMHALDYVLKPFGRPRFDAAVRRALERLEALDALAAITMQRTLEAMASGRRERVEHAGELTVADARTDNSLAPYARRIGVRVGTRIVLVDVERIDWVEAQGDYTRIHAGSESYLVLQRMHSLETLLDPAKFVRVHRSVIVNAERIRELYRESDGGGCIVLENRVRLRVARSRWEELGAALGMRTV